MIFSPAKRVAFSIVPFGRPYCSARGAGKANAGREIAVHSKIQYAILKFLGPAMREIFVNFTNYLAEVF
jgi:hypothetical protein